MQDLQLQRKPETIAFLEQAVLHHECNQILSALERCIKTYGRNETGLMIVGETGLGKSTCVHIFKKNFNRTTSETHTFQPVVIVVTPVNATVKSLSSALLKQLGCPKPDRGSADSMFLRITTLVAELKTKIIIFDEIQHLSERNAQKKTLPVINFVKNLMTETHCPIVLVGMPDATELLKEPQLNRRFAKSIRLRPFRMKGEMITEDYTDEDLYLSFLNTISTIMPIKTINLLDINVARRLLAASSGKIGILITIFETLIENNNQGQVANLEDFSIAFRQIADHDINDCPFLISTKKMEALYF
ncbi:TniB family NTP-binding protein [Shewanella basaltis]|uniref:TniB family NTP-binding protein n=1 Tax=Shewanella basaltis TaxID=472183 RepID=UPI003AAEA1C7